MSAKFPAVLLFIVRGLNDLETQVRAGREDFLTSVNPTCTFFTTKAKNSKMIPTVEKP